MKNRIAILGWAAGLSLGFAATASAQRVTWGVSFSSGPIFVSSSQCRPVFVAPPPPVVYCPPPAVYRPPPVVYCPPAPRYRPPPPPPPPPPVLCRDDYPIRRAGVYAYARGPRRVIYPYIGHPGLIQEWCPVSNVWMNIGVQAR